MNISTMKERYVLRVIYMLISPDLMMIINRVYVLQSITLYTKNMCNCCQLKNKENPRLN